MRRHPDGVPRIVPESPLALACMLVGVTPVHPNPGARAQTHDAAAGPFAAKAPLVTRDEPSSIQPTPTGTGLTPTATITPGVAAPVPTATPTPGQAPTATPTAPSIPTPTPTPASTPSVLTTRRTSMYLQAGLVQTVVGEVVNGSNHAVQSVEITATFYGAAGNILATETGYSEIDVIPAGGDVPFTVTLFAPPAGITRFTLVAVALTDPAEDTAISGLVAQQTEMTLEDDTLTLKGTVKNTSSAALVQVVVVIAAYDAAGRVVRVEFASADPDGRLAPGATATWETTIDTTGTTIVTTRLFPDALPQ